MFRQSSPLAIGALMLAACVSAPVSSSVESADLGAADLSARSFLVLDARVDVPCRELLVDFTALPAVSHGGDASAQPLKTVTLTTVAHKSGKPSSPGAIELSPGTYRISGARCLNEGYRPSTLPNVDTWFRAFQIAPGEVVYPGTLDMSVQTARVSLGKDKSGVSVIDFGRAGTEQVSYPIYTLKNEIAGIRAALGETNPSLVNRLVLRMPDAVVSAEQMMTAYDIAYAPDADGRAPNAADASKRLAAELKAVRVAGFQALIDAQQTRFAEGLASGGHPADE